MVSKLVDGRLGKPSYRFLKQSFFGIQVIGQRFFGVLVDDQYVVAVIVIIDLAASVIKLGVGRGGHTFCNILQIFENSLSSLANVLTTFPN